MAIWLISPIFIILVSQNCFFFFWNIKTVIYILKLGFMVWVTIGMYLVWRTHRLHVSLSFYFYVLVCVTLALVVFSLFNASKITSIVMKMRRLPIAFPTLASIFTCWFKYVISLLIYILWVWDHFHKLFKIKYLLNKILSKMEKTILLFIVQTVTIRRWEGYES